MTETLTRRLDRLERQNRRLKQGFALLVVTAAAVAMMGQARPGTGRVIEAERFVLRDSAGRERAELFTLEDGSPGLYLYGYYGGRRLSLLSLEADQASGTSFLQLNAGNGKTRISVATAPVGSAVVNIADLDGNVRASLGVGRDGSGGIGTFDKGGKIIWKAP